MGVIGPATGKELEQRGIIPDFCPSVYTGEGLVEDLRSIDIAGQHFLLPRADIADEELTTGIVQLGGKVDEIAVYRTVPPSSAGSKASGIRESGKIDIITFTSSSTVKNFLSLGGKALINNSTRIACIGPKTADAAARAGLRVDIIAGEQTIPGLVAEIEEYFRKEA